MGLFSIAPEIEQKTQEYWRISRVWNLRSEEVIPTGEAIVVCKNNMVQCNPARPIYQQTTKILAEIVKGQGSSRPTPATVHILPSITAIGE